MKLKITEDLAELLGAITGDGSISISRKNYRLTICGHSENDFNYLTCHLNHIIYKLLGKKPRLWKFKNKNGIAININSKEVINFLISIGMPYGKKSQTIQIPKIILEGNSKIKSAFIRGVSDTDFSVAFHKGYHRKYHSYPIITGNTSSKILAEQIVSILKEFGIKANINERKPHGFSKVTQYAIYIYGKDNFSKWMKIIGFRNQNHLSKIAIWEKVGFYVPYTPMKERLLILRRRELVPKYKKYSTLGSSSG